MTKITILPERELQFSIDETTGFYLTSFYLSDISKVLAVGEEYLVLWEGSEYVFTAEATIMNGADFVYIGNKLFGGGENDGVPFVLASNTYASAPVWIVASFTEENKTVSVYQVIRDGVDVVLKDRNGDDVVYEGVKKVSLTDVDGNDVIFSEGELMEGLEIDLDMSSGDQTVEAPKGYFVKKATIKKPETLRPENILQDVDVAGVVGELKVSTPTETTIEPDFSEGDMEVVPEDGTMFSKVTIPTPETLIPENIAEGINIAGILGTLATGGGGGSNVKIAYGTIKGSNSSGLVRINHNLGEIPDLVFACINTTGNVPSTASTSTLTSYIGVSSALKAALGNSFGSIATKPSSTAKKVYHWLYSSNTLEVGSAPLYSATTGTEILLGVSNYSTNGYTYFWCAIAGIV